MGGPGVATEMTLEPLRGFFLASLLFDVEVEWSFGVIFIVVCKQKTLLTSSTSARAGSGRRSVPDADPTPHLRTHVETIQSISLANY